MLLVSASVPAERCARVRREAAADEAALQRELDREIEALWPRERFSSHEWGQRRQAEARLHQPARGRQGAPLR